MPDSSLASVLHPDWQKQLLEWDDEEVKQRLSTTFDPHGKESGHTSVSLMHRVQNPAEGQTPAEAMAEILEEMGDYTEAAHLTMAQLWHYTEKRELWNTHPNPALRSAKAFLGSLTHGETIAVGIAVGTSTDAAKRGSIGVIERVWGGDWYEQIPETCRLPYETPRQAPKRMLYQIAAMCKAGMDLKSAALGWHRARMLRTNDDHRKRTRSTAPKTKDVIVADIVDVLRKHSGVELQGRRLLEQWFAGEVHEDRIALRGPKSTPQDTGSGTAAATGGNAGRKRRNGVNGEGDSQRKRRRRRSVGDLVDGEAGEGEGNGDEEEAGDVGDDEEGGRESEQQDAAPECSSRDWLAVWLRARKMLEDAPCCDVCRPYFVRINDCLKDEDEIHRMVDRLTEVRRHKIGDRVFLLGSNA